MKMEEFKACFEKIKPDESAKMRMLDNILRYHDRKKAKPVMPPIFKKAVPALALVVVIAGSLLAYNMMSGNNYNNNYSSQPGYGLQPPHGVAEDARSGREDMVAPILDQFQIDGRHYVLLSDGLRADYGLPAVIKESDIGEKIADIAVSPDKSLIGSEVYSYIPAGGEAVVAVKKDNEYRLFRFFTFESYNNNQDEDAIEYLILYGINKADDIAKIQFICHSEKSKMEGRPDIIAEITDRDEITRFYSFYSVLKNSSDKYFDKLFNYQSTGSGNRSVEIDPAGTDITVPPNAIMPGTGGLNEAEPGMVGPDAVKPGMVEPDAIRPDMVGPDTKAPDHIGYGDDLPMNIAPDHTGFAEDTPLIITGNDAAVSVTVDTPVENAAVPATGSSHGMMDMGDIEAGSAEPGQSFPGQPGLAVDALANPVTIRIYNRSGVYYDSVYYMNIGFISRYEINEEFAEFIGKYLNR